ENYWLSHLDSWPSISFSFASHTYSSATAAGVNEIVGTFAVEGKWGERAEEWLYAQLNIASGTPDMCIAGTTHRDELNTLKAWLEAHPSPSSSDLSSIDAT